MKKQLSQLFVIVHLLFITQLNFAQCPGVMVESYSGFKTILTHPEVEVKACELGEILNISSAQPPVVLIYNWYSLQFFQNKQEGFELLYNKVIGDHANDPYYLIIIKEHHENGQLTYRSHLKLPDSQPSNSFDAIEQQAIGRLVNQVIIFNAEANGNIIAKSYLADIAGIDELIALISREKTMEAPLLSAGFKIVEVYEGSLEWEVDNTSLLNDPLIFDFAGVKTLDGNYIRDQFQAAFNSLTFDAPAVIITSNTMGSLNSADNQFNILTQKLICWFHYVHIEENNTFAIYYKLRDNFTEEEAIENIDGEYEKAMASYWATEVDDIPPSSDDNTLRNNDNGLAKSGGDTGAYDCNTIPCGGLDLRWRAYCCILPYYLDDFQVGIASGLIDGLLETINFAKEAGKIVVRGVNSMPLTPAWHFDILLRAWKERSFWRAFKNKIVEDVEFYESMGASMVQLVTNGHLIIEGIITAIKNWLYDLSLKSGIDKTGYAIGKLGFEIILEFFTGGAGTFKKISNFSARAFKELAELTSIGKTTTKVRDWFDGAYEGGFIFKSVDKAKILKFQILAANCFLAGTPVQVDQGSLNIEQITLGQAVSTHKWVNSDQIFQTGSRDLILPIRKDIYTSDEQKALDGIEFNEEPWYELSLVVQKNSHQTSQIYLLRPKSWLIEHQIEGEGSEVWLSLPEQNINENAIVSNIQDFLYPKYSTSKDPTSNFELQPVTGIFVNTSNDVWRLIFDTEDTLYVTSAHPFYSLHVNAWRMVSELSISETLLTERGQSTLVERSKLPGYHQVYNLEVREHHNFCVGKSGIVAHNAYKIADLKKLRERIANEPTFLTAKDKDNVYLKTISEMDEPLFKQFLDEVGENGKVRVELVKAWEDWFGFSNLRKNTDLLENYYPKRQKILLDIEETLGGHSIARHGPHLSLSEMQQRVLGTHPTLGQSRSALRFDNAALHKDAVDQAFNAKKVDIEAHFDSGNTTNFTVEHDFGSQVGAGYTNTGTLSNPTAVAVNSTKVKLVFKVDPSNPTGYKLLTAYPSYP